MNNISLLHIALIYLAVINVVTFFVYGIDKWKAKKFMWRVSEAALLGLAVVGGSIGAWLGMKTWNPIGLHMEFYEDGDYIVSKWHPEKNLQRGRGHLFPDEPGESQGNGIRLL